MATDVTEIYRVKGGDNLTKIAREALGDAQRWPEIAHLNGLRIPYLIYPGQVLELPPREGSGIVEVTIETPAAIAQNAPHKQISPAAVLVVAAIAAVFLVWDWDKKW